MAVIEVKCRYCGQATVVKNGRAPNGLQRFHCRACRRYFQVEYRYNGRISFLAKTFNSSNALLAARWVPGQIEVNQSPKSM